MAQTQSTLFSLLIFSAPFLILDGFHRIFAGKCPWCWCPASRYQHSPNRRKGPHLLCFWSHSNLRFFKAGACLRLGEYAQNLPEAFFKYLKVYSILVFRHSATQFHSYTISNTSLLNFFAQQQPTVDAILPLVAYDGSPRYLQSLDSSFGGDANYFASDSQFFSPTEYDFLQWRRYHTLYGAPLEIIRSAIWFRSLDHRGYRSISFSSGTRHEVVDPDAEGLWKSLCYWRWTTAFSRSVRHAHAMWGKICIDSWSIYLVCFSRIALLERYNRWTETPGWVSMVGGIRQGHSTLFISFGITVMSYVCPVDGTDNQRDY